MSSPAPPGTEPTPLTVGISGAACSGLDPALIASLLPAVTSMALGGLGHIWNNQGQGAAASPAPGGGGLLGSLVSAVTGALGGDGAQGELGSLINMFAPGVAVSPGLGPLGVAQ